MRDPGQREAAHGAALARADGGRTAQGDRRQQVQHAFDLFDDDAALGHAFEAEEAQFSEAGVEVRQDIDGLRHLGQRIAAGIEGIADDGHGETLSGRTIRERASQLQPVRRCRG